MTQSGVVVKDKRICVQNVYCRTVHLQKKQNRNNGNWNKVLHSDAMRLIALVLYLRTTRLASRHLNRVQQGPAQQKPVKHSNSFPKRPVLLFLFRFLLFRLFFFTVACRRWQSGKNSEVALNWTESRSQRWRKVRLPSVNQMFPPFFFCFGLFLFLFFSSQLRTVKKLLLFLEEM